MNTLDLFCGAGGLSQGFIAAGFNIVAGIDNDRESLDTFRFNHEGSKGILYDLSNNNISAAPDLSGVLNTPIDAVIGGPPCQGFSLAGKRLVDDPRNSLYKVYLHFIEILNPSIIVMENVPSLARLYEGKIYDEILKDFNHQGYHVTDFVLNAAEYGVPQARRRIFFVATKKGVKFHAPEPVTKNKPITSGMAISDLPLLEDGIGFDGMDYPYPPQNEYQLEMRNGSEKIYNHIPVEHKQRTKDIISLVPDGGNYKSLPLELQGTRKVNIAWTRLNSQKPSFTIDAGHNHHFHYIANRVPTVRESARIQSFPDRFRFFGKKTSLFRQVGNAVPPKLAEVIARGIE